MTGIGGQGVQLASAVLAHAAVIEGREAQLFGSYAGMMRGGATESTVVLADGPIEAPPTVSRAWAVLVMHHEHAATVARPAATEGGLAFFDPDAHHRVAGARGGGATVRRSSRFRPRSSHARPATSMAASMVMVGGLRGRHRPGRTRVARSTPPGRCSPPTARSTRGQRARRLRTGFGAAPGRSGAGVGRPGGGGAVSEGPTVTTRGTVVIDVEACKGCNLCIDACPPGCSR